MIWTLVYLLAVVPVLLVVTAAVWPPRPWQAALIVAGPLISLAAVTKFWPFWALGWLSTLGVAYAVLMVTPVLRWRRRWPRIAVPGTSLAVCAVLGVAAEGEVAVLFYLGAPGVLALGALLLGLARTWRMSSRAPS